MRHIALRVADVERAQQFYCRTFGMRVVWQPDPDNVYLSSGADNLALHKAATPPASEREKLDHIGFFIGALDDLQDYFAHAAELDLEVVRPLRHHRDGTSSFYIRDPDGVIIQLLYDPEMKRD